MIKKEKIILALIFLLAFGVRLINVGSHPTFISDEASIGYNAWSILKTGKDEWGKFLPLSFKAFGEYKLPLYIYFTVSFVWIFGLTELAVRLPSVIFGSFTVVAVYFLVKKLFFDKKELPLIASFLLAISPWHIQASRMALEANLSLFLVVVGAILFLKGLNNQRFLLFSFIILAISFYAYNACRIFVPLLLGGWLFLNRQKIKNFKNLFWPGVMGIIILIPLLISGFRGTGERLEKVGIFYDPGIKSAINEKRGICLETKLEIICRGIYNRPVFYSLNFVRNYLSHFSWRFLFAKGGVLAQYGVPGRGEFYFFELPLIVLGIIWLIKNYRSVSKLLFTWVFFAPIANSFTGQAHPVRAIFILPIFQIFAAGGLIFVMEFFKKKTFKTLVILIFLGIAALSFKNFLIDYFVNYPRVHTSTWQAGYKPLYLKLAQMENNYRQIFVTKFYGEPHIFYLFYRQYSPGEYQGGKEVIRYDREDKWVNVDKVGKYWFFEKAPLEMLKKEDLIAIAPSELNFEFKILDEIKYQDGKTAFLIGEIK